MSEMGQNVMGASFSVPAAQDFNTLGFQGSMQQVLQENVGSYVVVEFLMGQIGKGTIGLDAIVNIINHPKLKHLPFVLETPNDLDGWKQEIALLKSLSL